jgi:hypothetical protein
MEGSILFVWLHVLGARIARTLCKTQIEYEISLYCMYNLLLLFIVLYSRIPIGWKPTDNFPYLGADK